MLNRIISILVVVALAVLAFPFFVGHYDGYAHVEIPKAPPFPSQQAQNETIHALKDSVPELLTVHEKAAHAQTVALSHQAKIKSYAKSTTWIVHLGNYRDKITALRLANQLRAKGYKAFIYQKGAAFGEEVGVYIGPESQKEQAELLAMKISKEMRLAATVKSYSPLAA